MSVGELRRRPVTRRHVLTQVGGIAVPILLSTVVSLVAPLVNAAIVGHGRAGDLYVLALVLPVVLLLNSVNESLRVSSVAFSSQASGDGNLRAFRSRLRGLLIIGVTINLSIALVFLVGHRQFMTIYAVPEIHQGTVFRFMQLSILTGTLLGVSMLLMSSLYGFRQVRAVTVVTVIGLGGNVAINAALVPWAGIWSLPIATTVSAGATIIWAARRLSALGVLPGTKDVTVPLAVAARQIRQISLPVCFGYLLIFADSLLFTKLLAHYSPTEVAGFGAAYRIQDVALIPAVAIGIGLAVNVNRMVAAGDPQDVTRYLSTTIRFGFALFAVIALVTFTGRDLISGWMTGDQEVAQAAAGYLLYIAPAYAAFGPLLILSVLLEETGNGFRALTFNVGLTAGQLLIAWSLVVAGRPIGEVLLAVALTYLAAIAFIVHELARGRRLGGRIGRISQTDPRSGE